MENIIKVMVCLISKQVWCKIFKEPVLTFFYLQFSRYPWQYIPTFFIYMICKHKCINNLAEADYRALRTPVIRQNVNQSRSDHKNKMIFIFISFIILPPRLSYSNVRVIKRYISVNFVNPVSCQCVLDGPFLEVLIVICFQ